MKTQIPIYRAKKIDSDEYVEGYYFHTEMVGDYTDKEADERKEWIEHFLVSHMSHDTWDDEEGYTEHVNQYQIDPSTLAIHLPDMKDSEGTKIFASLSEDGKGGDNMKYKNGLEMTAKYLNHQFYHCKKDLKVTGIQS